MNQVLLWAGVVVCAAVLLACICRVNLLQSPKLHRMSWGVLYIAYALFALGTLLDLILWAETDWWVCAGIAGVMLQLLLTHKDWKRAAPTDLKQRTLA